MELALSRSQVYRYKSTDKVASEMISSDTESKMAKPTSSETLELARKISSTVVPLEQAPLRRPYLKPGTLKPIGPHSRDIAVVTADSNRGGEMKRGGEAKLTSEPKPLVVSKPARISKPAKNVKETLSKLPVKEKMTPVAPARSKRKNQLDVAAVEHMLGDRLGRWRPSAWEDDISRNTLDQEPFENLSSPSELPRLEFERAIEFVNYVASQVDAETLEAMIARDRLPIPCPKDREGYSPGYDGVYWMSGLTDYLKIMEVAKRYGVEPDSCFDFGCASGRVLRHFAVQSDLSSVWGSDINGRHIRWLEEYTPQHVRPIFNHCIPAIPIADHSIDIVSAFSVFTHIDTFESCWLAELNRILRPGGLCYLTVHNEDTWEVLRKEIDNRDNRLVQSIMKVDPEFKEQIHQPMPDRRSVYRFTNFGPYRAQVFHSNNYLNRVWGRMFEIKEILPCHHVRQSVVVLQKRG